MRYLVFAILLFLPLILYFLWVSFVRRKEEETGGQWDDWPLTRLFLAGLALMGVALVIMRFTNEGEPPGDLVPERYEDDRFIRDPADWQEGDEPR